MGVLRRLFGGGEQLPGRPLTSGWDRRPSWMYAGMEVQLCEGRVSLEVVGEASYQDNLWQVVGRPGQPNRGARSPLHRTHGPAGQMSPTRSIRHP
jgi:hypothetical protein